MNELDMLKDALTGPGPSSDTVRKGRGELEQLVRRQSRARTRRPSWPMAGIGLAAAAVAVAVTAAVVVTSGTPRTRPGAPVRSTAIGHRPATAKQSVQQMLLTAAASAQRAPAESGTYWYVRVRAATGNGNKLYLAESWTKRDGQTWIRDQKTGPPIELPRSPLTLGPFFLGGREVTFHQLQHLPADPAALTRWIVTNAARHGGKTGSGPAPSKAQEREDIFDSLDSLLSELPATPQVRAAAFRALAALPGVTSLSQIGGGQGLRFTLLGGQRATLVIDPASGQIRATNFFVDNQGGEFWQQIPNATITGRWTNTLP
jgi:hypothetical protein